MYVQSLTFTTAIALCGASALHAHSFDCHQWHSGLSEQHSCTCSDTRSCDVCVDNASCEYDRAHTVFMIQGNNDFSFTHAINSLLKGISVQSDQTHPYNRNSYHRTWGDRDGDCQNERHEVLLHESIIPATLSQDNCLVMHGLWYDHYTGTYYTDPTLLDIDHFVPLAEVHRSGANQWSQERRHAYAQDIDNAETLIAVSSSANRQKRDRDPSKWMPENEAYHCEYLGTWIKIKRTWQLSMDSIEYREIIRLLSSCGKELQE